MPFRAESLVLVLIVFLASACAIAPATPSPTPQVFSKPRPTQDPSPDPETIINSQRVRRAVVRVVAEGSFALSEEGTQQEMTGSGFILESSGVVVTNHRVVTGAREIKVYSDGESEPHNAEVLGTAECADLAVIRIDGQGWPTLKWHDGEVQADMDVYVGGYEQGSTSYSFEPGTVSDERTDGNTPWMSVESVIKHTIAAPTSYSGGPLLAADGKLVGINYGGERFALGREQATDLIDRMIAGERIQSIGVNGVAATVKVENEDVPGVWITAVQPGSPADEALLRRGDLIVGLDGQWMAEDGTLAAYCAVLREHDSTDVLDVVVFRQATEEVLAGQINGRPLVVVPPATPTAAPPTAVPPSPTPAPPPTATPRPSLVSVLGDVEAQQLRDGHPGLRGQFRELLFDTFDSAGANRRWNPANDPLFTRALRNSYYALTLKQKDTLTTDFWRQGTVGASYIVEADVNLEIENSQGTHAFAGIAFDNQDANNGLFFVISNDRSWTVALLQNGQLVTDYSGTFQSTVVAGGTNQLRVVRLPDQIQLWVNDRPVGLLPASPFAGGRVGVAGRSGTADLGAPVTVVVDNFRVLGPR